MTESPVLESLPTTPPIHRRNQDGGGEYARLVMAQRSAQEAAGFLLPHLAAGMQLIDCGCGPGSITLGLAEVVAPGEVIGVDVSEAALQAARVLAGEHGVANVRFERASVLKLPFPDGELSRWCTTCGSPGAPVVWVVIDSHLDRQCLGLSLL
jgi:SAM-dependent methyltransferase